MHRPFITREFVIQCTSSFAMASIHNVFFYPMVRSGAMGALRMVLGFNLI